MISCQTRGHSPWHSGVIPGFYTRKDGYYQRTCRTSLPPPAEEYPEGEEPIEDPRFEIAEIPDGVMGAYSTQSDGFFYTSEEPDVVYNSMDFAYRYKHPACPRAIN